MEQAALEEETDRHKQCRKEKCRKDNKKVSTAQSLKEN